MDNGVPVYLPRELATRVDAVAHDELRSRTNATRWLLERALREREPAAAAAVDELREVS